MQRNENKEVYEVKINNEGNFFFETINGLFYIAGFFTTPLLEPKQYAPFLYEFSFSTEDKSTISDQKICNTIIHILKDFLTDKNKILYYVCDDLDNKNFCRDRLFSMWYNKYSDNEYTKIDLQYLPYKISVIMHKHCIFHESVITDCSSGEIYIHLNSLK